MLMLHQLSAVHIISDPPLGGCILIAPVHLSVRPSVSSRACTVY